MPPKRVSKAAKEHQDSDAESVQCLTVNPSFRPPAPGTMIVNPQIETHIHNDVDLSLGHV